jgi:hypothetical protein
MTAALTRASAVEILVDALESCADDPVRFAELFLPGYGSPWSRQREILESVVRFKCTCVYAGNMTGKSWTIAILVIWFLLTHPDALVIVTGASQQTVGSIVWKQIARAVDNCILRFGGKVSTAIKASPAVVSIAPGWQALGFATTGVERASGQHAKDLMVIVDEASGVDEDVWFGLDSLGASRMVLFGNPLRSSGPFISAIRQSDKDRRDGVPDRESVNAIQIPSTDSPHAHMDRSPWGLADRPWLEQMTRKYGPNSLWVKAHIKAEIPIASAEILILECWLDYLLSLPAPDRGGPNHPIHATRRIACDLSEGVGRDSTCVLVRDDWGVLDVTLSSGQGLSEAAATIAHKAHQWGVLPNRITYDRGGLGKQLPNHLQRLGIVGATPYIGAGSPADESYVNLRTECAFRLRNRLDMTWFVRGEPSDPLDHDLRPQVPFSFCPGLYLDRLREDLRPLTYSLVNKCTKLLNKEDHAAILGRSPDVFDSLCISFYP